MKVYAAVIGVVVLLLALGFYTQHALQSTADRMLGGIRQLDAVLAGDDWDRATGVVKAIQEDWERHKKWWAVFIDHQEIDNIDTSLVRTSKYIETRESAQAAAELGVLELMLKHIPEKERVNLQNIL